MGERDLGDCESDSEIGAGDGRKHNFLYEAGRVGFLVALFFGLLVVGNSRRPENTEPISMQESHLDHRESGRTRVSSEDLEMYSVSELEGLLENTLDPIESFRGIKSSLLTIVNNDTGEDSEGIALGRYFFLTTYETVKGLKESRLGYYVGNTKQEFTIDKVWKDPNYNLVIVSTKEANEHARPFNFARDKKVEKIGLIVPSDEGLRVVEVNNYGLSRYIKTKGGSEISVPYYRIDMKTGDFMIYDSAVIVNVRDSSLVGLVVAQGKLTMQTGYDVKYGRMKALTKNEGFYIPAAARIEALMNRVRTQPHNYYFD